MNSIKTEKQLGTTCHETGVIIPTTDPIMGNITLVKEVFESECQSKRSLAQYAIDRDNPGVKTLIAPILHLDVPTEPQNHE